MSGYIYLYNSLTRTKELFEPLNGKVVKMYECGITPYAPSHLGHGVAAIRFNMIRSYLTFKGFDVVFVRNITNIDDKIIQKSISTGIPTHDITTQVMAEYHESLSKLGLIVPNHEPDVVTNMKSIIAYISNLIEKEFAYQTSKGNVYFNVNKKKDYGKLSQIKIVDCPREISINKEKKSPRDFALWKIDDNKAMAWDSPWGKGRPGWHIECSVLCHHFLGEQIDIHCGGLDLLFPHHENEIAQCESHNNKFFSKYWLHCGLLNISNKKMSKSSGRIIPLKTAIERYGSELIKLTVLRSHYRSTINLDNETFADNINILLKFYRNFNLLQHNKKYNLILEIVNKFDYSMSIDFNSSKAITFLINQLNLLNKKKDKDLNRIFTIQYLGQQLGLFKETKLIQIENELMRFQSFLYNTDVPNPLPMINARNYHRRASNFRDADNIRNNLFVKGIKLLDGKDGLNEWEFIIPTK